MSTAMLDAPTGPSVDEIDISRITIEGLDLAEAETSLASFLRQSLHTVFPGARYIHGWHIDAVAEHLEAVTAGHIAKLIITLPPKMFKSTIVSVQWPAWVWASNPWLRWLFTSYSNTLLVRDSRFCRNLVESEWYQERWGDRFQLCSDQNEKVNYETTAGGARLIVPLGGAGTGSGGHVIVCDDPHDAVEVWSDTKRQEQIDSWNRKLAIRHIPGASINALVVVCQRTHPRDLVNDLHAQGGWVHLNLPNEFIASKRCATVLGWKDPRKEDGELLWPEVIDEKKTADLKVTLGEVGYSAQGQQEPRSFEGSIIKRHWLRFYRQAEKPKTFDTTLHSWDLTFKETGTSNVAGGALGVVGANKYFFDVVRDKMSFGKSLDAVRNMAAKWPSEAYVVEDKANGPALENTLKNEIPGIVLFSPGRQGKVVRLLAVLPEIEAGNLWLPHPDECVWVNGFLDRICAFSCDDDESDEVDIVTQALLYIRDKNNGPMVF